MDFLFLFLLLVLLAGLFFSIYRLNQLRTVLCLTSAASQAAVTAFLILSFLGGVYHEPFVVLTSILIGVAAPLGFFILDAAALRKKISDRYGLSLTRFLYRDDREEALKIIEKEKYVDHILRPRAENYSIGEIINEIRVERADTSKNIQRQLDSAAKKYSEEDFDGAYAAYLIVEKFFNRSPSLYLNLGNIDYDRNKFEDAARNYKQGTECVRHKDFEHDDMSHKLGLLYYNLGNALFLQKKYARAIEAYKLAVESFPANADALYNMSFCHAMDFEETGDTEKALDAFKQLIEDMPENLHAWYHYGVCLLKMKNAQQAIECFHKVVDEDIMFYEAWYRMAIAFDESGMIADAVKAYYTSIQIKPDFIDAYNNLGVLLSTAGRHGEALKVFKSGLRIKPGDTELIYNIGMTQYESGKYEDALGEFLTCERLKPDDVSVLYMSSVIYMRMGQSEDSMRYLEKAVHIDPSIGARASKEEIFQPYAARTEYSGLFA